MELFDSSQPIKIPKSHDETTLIIPVHEEIQPKTLVTGQDKYLNGLTEKGKKKFDFLKNENEALQSEALSIAKLMDTLKNNEILNKAARDKTYGSQSVMMSTIYDVSTGKAIKFPRNISNMYHSHSDPHEITEIDDAINAQNLKLNDLHKSIKEKKDTINNYHLMGCDKQSNHCQDLDHKISSLTSKLHAISEVCSHQKSSGHLIPQTSSNIFSKCFLCKKKSVSAHAPKHTIAAYYNVSNLEHILPDMTQAD